MSAIDFAQIFSRIPLLASAHPEDFTIKPLSGLTNFNFHLRGRDGDFVLRVPKKVTSQLIDRRIEAFNEDQVVKQQFAPQVIWRDDSGLSLSHCITHSRNLHKTDMADESVVALLVEQLRVLHNADIKFKGQTDIIELLKYYFNLMLEEKKHRFAACIHKALRLHQTVHARDNRLVSSHNDLVLENLLIDEQAKLWLIDWEYSALSSPYWDLATVCNSARLDSRGCLFFLKNYNGDIHNLSLENLQGYCFILQLLTVVWMTVFADAPVEEEVEWLKTLDKLV